LADHIPRLYRESRQFRESMDRHSKSYQDSRVKAVVSIAPAPPVRAFEPHSLQEIAIPVHIIVGRGDTEAPFDECALWLQKQNAAFDVDLLDTNVGHYVFLPEATETGKKLEPSICSDPDGVDRRAIHDNTVAATEQLFRRVIEKGLS
ncbi:MAG: signal peptidase, partial [Pseudomonadota bacterium]